MRSAAKHVWLLLFVVITSSTAYAHLPSPRFGDYYGGVLHPLTALEHLLPIVALGLLAGQSGSRAARAVLLSFPGGLALGLLVSLMIPEFEYIKALGLLSFLVLGGLVTGGVTVRIRLLVAIAFLTGLVHGFGNGTALTGPISAWLFFLGVLSAGVILVSLIPAAVVSMRKPWMKVAVRVLGSWITAIGLMVMALGMV